VSKSKAHIHGRLVLVVDDNPANFDLLNSRLLRDGHRVEFREDAVALETDVETPMAVI
jgi:CheY-like chemotaxis protein